MPPPTNVNVAVQLYSKRFITRLQKHVAFLKAFSTNFSDEFGNPGTTIDVPIISADPAADWNDATNNFSRPATDVTTRPVTLNQRKITGFSITMMHLAKFLPHWWEGKADLNAAEIARAIVDPVLALLTPENFGSTAETNLVWNPTTMTLKDVADLRTKLINKGTGLYVLSGGVTVPQDEGLLPTDAELLESAAGTVLRYLQKRGAFSE